MVIGGYTRMAISRVGRSVTNPDFEVPKPPAARPSVPTAQPVDPNGVSKFDDPRRDPLCLNPSEGRGRGTNDDSVGRGRGTNDDSVGRKGGTNDDSIGRRGGTNDDSIGRGKGTNDDSIGGTTAVTSRDLAAVGPTYTAAETGHLATADLSAAARAQVDALIQNPETSRAAAYAFKSQTFANLPADQREKFIDVMAKSDPVGVKLMAVTCEKAGDLFFERASDGTTTLDSLDRMANTPSAKGFLNNTLADILKPDRIWQGDAPTCTVSTMQYELAKEKPAEYARLMTGLTVDGHVTLAGGGTLETNVSQAVFSSMISHDQRSPTEAVFQAAAMETANGADHYDVNARKSTGVDAQGNVHSYKGLYGDQIRVMTGKLFGIEYKTTKISSNEEAAAALATLNKSNVPNRPVLVDLVIDDKSNHCVAFEGFENGRVYFRDPQTGKKSSISQQEFLETAAAVHEAPLPTPRRIPRGKMLMMEE